MPGNCWTPITSAKERHTGRLWSMVLSTRDGQWLCVFLYYLPFIISKKSSLALGKKYCQVAGTMLFT